LEIYPDQRLEHLDQGTLKAFSAKAKDGTPSFALICERGLVPQPQLAVKYHSINTPFLPKLVGFGTVFWPLENQERFVFVYENKLGKPIAQADYGAGLGLKVDYVINTAVRNLVSLLKGCVILGLCMAIFVCKICTTGREAGLRSAWWVRC
jgi:hypothetical protein